MATTLVRRTACTDRPGRASKNAACGLAGCAALVLSACPDPINTLSLDAGTDPGNGGVLALAGPDLAVMEGSRVQLAGEGTRALAGSAALSWSQVAGPPVLLTNPSSALPTLVAPLAPATLSFELRAASDGDTSVDRVTIVVDTEAGASPAFLQVPGDTVAEPGATHTFNVSVAGNPSGAVTVNASACRGGTASVDGSTVTVTLPEVLPCGIVVDGIDDSGRGLAPAALVVWPSGTELPEETRLSAPLLVAPGGGASLSFAADPGSDAFAWSADGVGDVLGGLAEGDQVAFGAPRRRTRLAFAGERRRGSASGAVRVAFVEVTAGAGNVAPRASGGDDRIVQPSARFRIDTSGSLDLDGDVLQVSVTQVLGAAATPQETMGVFQAPASTGTLLFHVVADDGTVQSAPDGVRVVVSADAENLRPIVPIAPRRYVAPGQTFTVDGRIAEDPDSGVLLSVTIRQLAEDPVVLLTEPVELVATLVAGAAGDVYHFEITAFDDQGLGGSAFHEVHVEEAGPYVDPARGDDAVGNGTAAAPFLTVEGALPTAIDHALTELLLAEGEHQAVAAVLPAGLSLRGGMRFDGVGYLDDGSETLLPVGDEGLTVTDGKVAAMRLRLDEPTALVTLSGTASLARCTVEQAEPVPAGAVVVDAGANAVVEDCQVLTAVGPGPDSAVITVMAGGALRLRASSVVSGGGGSATGVRCARGTLALEAATVSGGLDAEVARGVDARLCNVDLSGASLVGGAGGDVVGLWAEDSVIAVDALSQVTGAALASGSATAVWLHGDGGSALLAGTLRAAPEGIDVGTAVGVHCGDGALALANASVSAAGESALAIGVEGAALLAQDSSIVATGGGSVAVGLAGAADVRLERVGASAERAIEGTANFVSLTDCVVQGAALGCSVPATFVVVEGGSIMAEGPGAAAALTARGAIMRDTIVAARGATAEGVRLTTAASILERSIVEVDGADGFGVTHAASLAVSSSFITARTVAALRSAGPVTLRSSTLVAGLDAVAIEAGGSLSAYDSALFGAPGVRALGAPPWLRAVAVAFDDVGSLVMAGAEDVTTTQRLLELGCEACLVVPATLVDATGHLTAGANALVDAGDSDNAASDDIDGEPRPSGGAPDIGCDERP